MTLLHNDKLRVFISSTLHECHAERTLARDIIAALNHLPVMFEALGARPHAPRPMYLRGVEDSAIFIAIYKSSYAWIAPDMDISGIEDEYRFATQRGLPRLIYAASDTTAREAPLARLLKEIKQIGGVTVSTYSTLSELETRIRDDLTATISERFLASNVSDLLPLEQPADVLRSLLPDPSHRLTRPLVVAELAGRLDRDHLTVVVGPLAARGESS